MGSDLAGLLLAGVDDCDGLLQKLEPQSRIKLLANIDILAADTFY